MKKIAVIGLGIMGNGIAANYLKAGYEVVVWNRSQEKTILLERRGAHVASTPKEAAEMTDIVFDVTPNDESSRSVWIGNSGILSGARRESILIASGTLSIAWIDELASHCREKNLKFLDIPLTGSRMGAESGSLVLLVGGDANELSYMKSDLAPISQQVIYFGPTGSGMKYKLILNMVQAIHICALEEALRIAERVGLDPNRVGDALAERPGGTTTQLAWSSYNKPPDPINFSIEWLTKDLRYAREMAEDMPAPLLDDVLKKYSEGISKGMAHDDWSAITRLRLL